MPQFLVQTDGFRDLTSAVDWTHERRLLFSQSEKWSGWFCARCCWNVPLPATQDERDTVAAHVKIEFRLRDCYAFAMEQWK